MLPDFFRGVKKRGGVQTERSRRPQELGPQAAVCCGIKRWPEVLAVVIAKGAARDDDIGWRLHAFDSAHAAVELPPALEIRDKALRGGKKLIGIDCKV